MFTGDLVGGGADIPNYTCISQGKYCSQHGGLVTYIHQRYSFEEYNLPAKSNLWEGLIIKINNCYKNIYICNIYRPPRDYVTNAILQMFTDELGNLKGQ